MHRSLLRFFKSLFFHELSRLWIIGIAVRFILMIYLNVIRTLNYDSRPCSVKALLIFE